MYYPEHQGYNPPSAPKYYNNRNYTHDISEEIHK